MSEQDIKHSIT